MILCEQLAGNMSHVKGENGTLSSHKAKSTHTTALANSTRSTNTNRKRESKTSEATPPSRPGSGKKRPRSPEIFAHNLKVLKKKSIMRRKKLAKEVYT